MSQHYEYTLPSAEKRAENARKMHDIHGAPVRSLTEIDAPTLPHHDPQERPVYPEEADDPISNQRRSYSRNVVRALGRLQEILAPSAELTQRAGDSGWQEYLRLTEYDEDGKPAWVIADHKENGHALFIWRRETATCDPDTAFSTTRRAALGHGCISLRHPANMDQLPQEDIENFYLEQVLEALTS